MRFFYILLLGIFALFSVCHKESAKRNQDLKKNMGIHTFYSNQEFHKIKKYIYPIEIVDSIIGDYQISYKYLINANELIPSSYTIEQTGDTLYYAETDILLCLKKNDVIYFSKKISKTDFCPFLEKKDIPRYSINKMLIEEIKNDSVSLFVNLCIPDTDICYDFIVIIRDDGSMNIKESYIDSEMFE